MNRELAEFLARIHLVGYNRAHGRRETVAEAAYRVRDGLIRKHPESESAIRRAFWWAAAGHILIPPGGPLAINGASLTSTGQLIGTCRAAGTISELLDRPVSLVRAASVAIPGLDKATVSRAAEGLGIVPDSDPIVTLCLGGLDVMGWPSAHPHATIGVRRPEDCPLLAHFARTNPLAAGLDDALFAVDGGGDEAVALLLSAHFPRPDAADSNLPVGRIAYLRDDPGYAREHGRIGWWAANRYLDGGPATRSILEFFGFVADPWGRLVSDALDWRGYLELKASAKPTDYGTLLEDRFDDPWVAGLD